MTWRIFTQNLGWKLGSLALAVLLWVAILGDPELVTTHTAPILYRNLARDLLIGSDALDIVRVELRGASAKLTPERLSETAVVLNLSDVSGPGERTFTLSNNDFHLPQGVTFVRAVPSQLRVRFSKLMSRDVPIEVKISAPPPYGYRVVSTEAAPSTVRIAGPQGRVQAVNTAQTDAIDLSGIRQTSEIRVNAFIADPQVRLESSPMVTVKVIVERTGNTN